MCEERHRCDEWGILVGLHVEIGHGGTFIRSGWVDAAMEDSSALWLAQDGAFERKLFDKAEGFSIWITAEQQGVSATRDVT